jgi:hypothetical protein
MNDVTRNNTVVGERDLRKDCSGEFIYFAPAADPSHPVSFLTESEFTAYLDREFPLADEVEDILDPNFDDGFDAPAPTKGDGHVRTGTVESTISETKLARFEEKCPKCRGTGRFTSYTGRIVGDCFNCKGSGVMKFRTSPEARKAARTGAANRKAAKATAKVVKGAEWLEANPARAAFLNNVGEFQQSLLAGLMKYGSLTDKQVAAIDRSMARDAERAVKATAPGGLDLSGVPSGLYATGDVEVKVDNIDKAGKWNEWVFVKTVDGSRIGSQRPGQNYTGKLSEELAVIAADPKAAVIAYGQKTGTCGCCGRKLTNPDSIEAGIGPVCASKF